LKEGCCEWKHFAEKRNGNLCGAVILPRLRAGHDVHSKSSSSAASAQRLNISSIWIALTQGLNLQYQVYRFGPELCVLLLKMLKQLSPFTLGRMARSPLTTAAE
jgi:hypothetical protein